MAPTITSEISNEQQLNNKMRKPVVEKIRRDRINNNNSIEQLKSLLAAEFLNQEKADILGMTVNFLRRQQQPAFSSSSANVNQDSRCVHEVVHFLSKEEVKKQSQRKLLNHVQLSTDEKRSESVLAEFYRAEDHQQSSVKNSLWRPW